MIVGLPKEIKDNEYRVGMTPAGVRALTDAGHQVTNVPTTVAQLSIAWVLHQPFPVWTLIGPATTGELHSSLRAVGVSLTTQESAWLNLESDAAG